jgi:hypothetical protein
MAGITDCVGRCIQGAQQPTGIGKLGREPEIEAMDVKEMIPVVTTGPSCRAKCDAALE